MNMGYLKPKQIEGYNENLLKQTQQIKQMQRQLKLCELSLASVEKENERLSKELEELKKLILSKNLDN
jgi:septal ring factor EnvC (AmiA/AmiB activator)